MIEKEFLLDWRKNAPWIEMDQVEQDLIISRALVEIYNHPFLQNELAFRGGTALQKCFFPSPTRYSEDLDFVQVNRGDVGPIFDALREVLEPWLGKPRYRLGDARATHVYRFISSTDNSTQMSLKIEINTEENYHMFDYVKIPFAVNSEWFSGQTIIKTYQINEIMGTKLRALYQRKKGRDLFDMACAIEMLPINVEVILDCFHHYLERAGIKITRAEFERNMLMKKNVEMFRDDIKPLLSAKTEHDFDKDFDLVMNKIITKLPGEPWKGMKDR